LTKEVVGDSTAPDQPSITVVSMDLKNMIVISSPKKGGVELKGAFLHFQIQAYLQGNGSWFDLDKTKSELVFHGFEPGDLGQVHKYRVRTWDTSNNYSPWSDESAWTTALKVGQTSLDDSVNTLLTQVTTNEGDITYNVTQISQNATDILLRAYQSSLDTTNGNVSQNSSEISLNATQIGLRVKWDGNETSIVLSQDGVHIQSSLLKIDGDVEITGDAVIQGILKANGGIKTSIGSNRIELSNYTGYADELRSYLSGNPRVKLSQDRIKFLDSGGSTGLVIKNDQISGSAIISLTGYIKSSNYIETDGVFKVAGNQVLGAQQPAIASSNGSQADNARAINELLEAFRKHGSIARGNQIALSEN